jgi:ribosomal protein S12 methylthiotransferase
LADTTPRVGFVSLGCPKALVDSERILTQLRSEGYDVVGSYESADLVVVNTCGFIDDAVHESLDAIGEALAKNGRVIVTGCLGAKPEKITERHPSVLKVTGPHAYEEVVAAVHEHLPPQHDPFVDLVPPQGIRLTPKHYAYLKISEGCNHRCSFCIIPSMRGDLASRPIGDVMGEAERLVRAGVKELLVISQDTSAYGVDCATPTLLGRQAAQDAFVELARALGHARRLGAAALRLSVSARGRRHSADGRRQGAAVPRHPVPARQPARAQAHARPAHARTRSRGSNAGARSAPDLTLRSTFIVGFPGETEQDSPCCSTGCARRSSIAWVVSSTRPSRAPLRTHCRSGARRSEAGPLGIDSWKSRPRSARRGSLQRSVADCVCSSIPSSARRPSHARPQMHPRSTASCVSSSRQAPARRVGRCRNHGARMLRPRRPCRRPHDALRPHAVCRGAAPHGARVRPGASRWIAVSEAIREHVDR